MKKIFISFLLALFCLPAFSQEEALKSMIYDKKGKLLQRNRVNYFGKLENDFHGIAIIRYEYDRRGHLIKKSNFDKNDKPFKPDTTGKDLPEFPSYTTYEYDKENLLQISNYNANGAFMDLETRAAVVKFRYNDYNQLVEEYNFDKTGKLRGVGNFEIATIKYQYMKNKLIEKKSFDKNRKVLNFGLNIAKYTYDDSSRVSKVSYFFANSELYLIDMFYYNSSGKIIKEEAYKKDGKLDYTLTYTYKGDQVLTKEFKYFNGNAKVEKHGVILDIPGWKMQSVPHIEEIKDVNGLAGFIVTVDKTGKITEVKKSFGENALVYAFYPYMRQIKLVKDEKAANTSLRGEIRVGILNVDATVEEY